jgi:hypothetical protein
VSFTAADATRTVTVPVKGDLLDEPDETFTLNLSNPSAGTIADGQGTATIADDDPAPAVSIDDVSVAEGDDEPRAASFAVTLSAASARTVTVGYATAPGTATAPADFTARSGTLTFAPGQVERTLPISVEPDLTDEPDENFSVQLSNPANATLGTAVGTGEILDDDPVPAASISDATVTEGDSGTRTVTLTVSLTNPSSSAIEIDHRTVAGSAGTANYVASSGTLTSAPGETTKAIQVAVTDEHVDEDDVEHFAVALAGPAGATLTRTEATGTIRDDDEAPTLSVTGDARAEGDPGGRLVFSLSLSTPSGHRVSVGYATADGTGRAPEDYAATAGTLVLEPGARSLAPRAAPPRGPDHSRFDRARSAWQGGADPQAGPPSPASALSPGRAFQAGTWGSDPPKRGPRALSPGRQSSARIVDTRPPVVVLMAVARAGTDGCSTVREERSTRRSAGSQVRAGP